MRRPKFAFGLRHKAWCATAAVLVTCSAVSGWLVFERSRDHVSQALESRARRDAELFARDASSFVSRRDIPLMRPPINMEKDGGDISYAALLSVDGAVINRWTSGKEPRNFRPGDVSIRRARVEDELWLFSDAPVMTASEPGDGSLKVAGWARVAYNLDRAEAAEKELISGLANIFIVCTGLGALLSYLLTRAFLRHVDRLTEGAESVSRGNLDVEVKVTSSDEIGHFARAFNRMVEKLRASEEEVSQHTRNLERRVNERTEELQAALDELKVLDRLKDEFLSLVSHELRTPLTSIRSFSELLLDVGPEDESTRQEFLEIIKLETERLTRLVNNVLELVKAEAGELDVKHEELDPQEVIDTAAASLFPLLRINDLSLDLQVEPFLERFSADRDMILQVLTNLISNAIKFSPKGGVVAIVACRRHDRFHFEVVDSGPGVPHDELGKIFERFKQVGCVLRDKPKGTGLGLPICRRIVDAHGGRVWAENRRGGGLRMVFELPKSVVPHRASDSEMPVS